MVSPFVASRSEIAALDLTEAYGAVRGQNHQYRHNVGVSRSETKVCAFGQHVGQTDCYADEVLRRWLAFVLLAACGPVPPASHRVPVSGGASTSGGPSTRPATDAGISGGDSNESSSETIIDDGITVTLGPPDGGDTCPQMARLEPLPGAIEVLVDVSSSMATQLVDHDDDPDTDPITRWNMLAVALAEHLPNLAAAGQLDLQLFPRADVAAPPDVDACSVSRGPGLGTSVDELLAELPDASAEFMAGATPTSAAMSTAYARLAALDGGQQGFIVLLTDGAPNCYVANSPPELFDQVDAQAVAWASSAGQIGISTYVVGVAVPAGVFGGEGSGEAFADHQYELSQVAAAGGTALQIAYDASALETAMISIEDATASCRTRLPESLFGGSIYLDVGGIEYYEQLFSDCGAYDGFARVPGDPSQTTLQLCGGACTAFRVLGTATAIESCGFPD